MPKSTLSRFVGLFALVAVMAIVSCLAVFHWLIRPQLHEAPVYSSFVELLDLNSEQQIRIEEIENYFDAERSLILGRFEQTTRNLAQLLMSEDEYSQQVEDAIAEVHHIHGELQALSVRRYFAILETLPVDKQQRLRKIAADALSQPE